MRFRLTPLSWPLANGVGLSVGLAIALAITPTGAEDAAFNLVWPIAGLSLAGAQLATSTFARHHYIRWALASTIAPFVGIPVGVALGFYTLGFLPDLGARGDSLALRSILIALFGGFPGGMAGLCTGLLLAAGQLPAIPVASELRTPWLLSNSLGWCVGGAIFGVLVILALPLNHANPYDWASRLIPLTLSAFIAGTTFGFISRRQFSRLQTLNSSSSSPQPYDAA
ncbi:MAG TPA: hypothetical protein VI729_12110 [Anaerolineales bacterium]|nr:hypothetical protein [Anaerolineales bacterium]